MSDLFWLTHERWSGCGRWPFFTTGHGKLRVCDRRVLSGIVLVNRNGLRWRGAPSAYGPHKTLNDRWRRWGGMGVFVRVMVGLAAAVAEPKTVMIDLTRRAAKPTRTARHRACG